MPRVTIGFGPNGALTLPGAPFQRTWALSVTEDASPDYNSSCCTAARFQFWAYSLLHDNENPSDAGRLSPGHAGDETLGTLAAWARACSRPGP
ncbi:hypothetical protein MA16_Dca018525 [Dendrobium catenatum]|uniref:Uncharacterized protein n=1 Tax=Dendrobium catenatum TaxID=906689 RepID=A0A2I0VQP8_9ASPA|nr:hypothetical protein MA16_Dca018525 [Dendrobium catenatum]